MAIKTLLNKQNVDMICVHIYSHIDKQVVIRFILNKFLQNINWIKLVKYV